MKRKVIHRYPKGIYLPKKRKAEREIPPFQYKNEIKIAISKNVINEILIESNYNEFGARKIDKIIKDNIENIIINNIIDNKKTVNIKSIKNLVTT